MKYASLIAVLLTLPFLIAATPAEQSASCQVIATLPVKSAAGEPGWQPPTTQWIKDQLAQSGCCSWHGGICGCDSGSGRLVCCDGALSPSCGC